MGIFPGTIKQLERSKWGKFTWVSLFHPSVSLPLQHVLFLSLLSLFHDSLWSPSFQHLSIVLATPAKPAAVETLPLRATSLNDDGHARTSTTRCLPLSTSIAFFGTIEHFFRPSSMVLTSLFLVLKEGTLHPWWNLSKFWHIFPWRLWLSGHFATKWLRITTQDPRKINGLFEIFEMDIICPGFVLFAKKKSHFLR